MKKMLLLLIAGLLVTGVAGASSLLINCGGATAPANASGAAQISSTAVSCPQFTVPSGQVMTDIILFFQNDYSLGNNSTTNAWNFNWVNVPTAFLASGTFSDQVSGGASSSTYTPSGNSFYQVGEIFSNFSAYLGAGSVHVADVSTSNVSGSLVPTNGHLDANVFIEFDYAPTGGVPEPVTMSLVGGGLLAVGLFARKRRKV